MNTASGIRRAEQDGTFSHASRGFASFCEAVALDRSKVGRILVAQPRSLHHPVLYDGLYSTLRIRRPTVSYTAGTIHSAFEGFGR